MLSTRNSMLIALIFLLFQVINFMRNSVIGYHLFFWFCDFASMLYFLAFITRNEQMAKGIIHFGLVPQTAFFISYILTAFFDVPLIVDLEAGMNSFFIISTMLVHSASMLALLFTLRTKPSVGSLVYSFGLIALIYIMILAFTRPEDNFNFVYNYADFSFVTSKITYKTYLWPILSFIFMVLPTYYLEIGIYQLHRFKCRRRLGMR